MLFNFNIDKTISSFDGTHMIEIRKKLQTFKKKKTKPSTFNQELLTPPNPTIKIKINESFIKKT